MKKIFLAAFLTAFAFSWVFAEIQTKDDKAFIKGLRPMGMGGAFIAVSDDDNAFFYNPAGISQRESFLLSIPLPPFIITAGVDLESFEMAEFINDNYDDLQNFNDLYDSGQAGDLIQKINDKVVGKTTNIYLSLLNPSYISGKIKAGGENYFNFGIGVFDYINIDAGFKHGMPVPAVYYKAQATAVIPVPVSYKINSLEKIGLPGSLSVGINFKYILRAKATDRVSLAELTNEDAYEFPAYLGKGFGADIGAIYHFNPRWNFGLQISDIFATSLKYENLKVNDSAVRLLPDAYTSQIPQEINIGAAYTPSKIYYWKGKYIETKNRFTFAADIRDIANADESFFDSPFKKLHFGGEYRLSPLALRAGVNSGYPSFGIGVETNYIQISYAFFGEELGRYAGQQADWNHQLRLSFVIGHLKGKSFGNKDKAEEPAKPDSAQEKPADDISEASPLNISSQDKLDASKPASVISVEIEEQTSSAL